MPIAMFGRMAVNQVVWVIGGARGQNKRGIFGTIRVCFHNAIALTSKTAGKTKGKPEMIQLNWFDNATDRFKCRQKRQSVPFIPVKTRNRYENGSSCCRRCMILLFTAFCRQNPLKTRVRSPSQDFQRIPSNLRIVCSTLLAMEIQNCCWLPWTLGYPLISPMTKVLDECSILRFFSSFYSRF